MTEFRRRLPQLDGGMFLTDGGIETTLVFHEGIDLPYFAAFDLLRTDAGCETLRRYYRRHASIAVRNGVGFVLESVTWRANADWGTKLGYNADTLARANRAAINLLVELRAEFETTSSPIVVSGLSLIHI